MYRQLLLNLILSIVKANFSLVLHCGCGYPVFARNTKFGKSIVYHLNIMLLKFTSIKTFYYWISTLYSPVIVSLINFPYPKGNVRSHFNSCVYMNSNFVYYIASKWTYNVKYLYKGIDIIILSRWRNGVSS